MRKSKQGNTATHLETLLSTYLVCGDRPAKQKLAKELQKTDDWGEPSMLYWARDFIERALKRSLEGPGSTATLRHPASFYADKELTAEAQEFTRENADLENLPTPPSVQIPSETRVQSRAVPTTRGPLPTPSEWYYPGIHPRPDWEDRQTRGKKEETKLGSGIATERTTRGDLGGNRAQRLIRGKREEGKAHENAKGGQNQRKKDLKPQTKSRDRPAREEVLRGKLPVHGKYVQESAMEEVQQHHGDGVDNSRGHSYTDLVPYRGIGPPQSPEKKSIVAFSPPISSPSSTVSSNIQIYELQDQDQPQPRLLREREYFGPAKGKETNRDDIIAEEREEMNRFGRYESEKPPNYDSTGVKDAFEEINKEKAHETVVQNPPPSPPSTVHPVEKNAKSTHNPEGIKHPERRTSWNDKMGRPGAPTRGVRTRPPSTNIDADGRPHASARARSDPGYRYVGDAPSGIRIRHESAGGRSTPTNTPDAAGNILQRPSGSRSNSVEDLHPRPRRPGPGSSAREEVDDGKLGGEGERSTLRRRDSMSTLKEDPEGEEEDIPSRPDSPSKPGESSKPHAALDPEPGISRSEYENQQLF